MSRELFVFDSKLTVTDDEIGKILEMPATKKGISAKANIPRRNFGKELYVSITKSEGVNRK